METPVFARRAEALLSPEERYELIDFLANNPMAGDLVPGLGGIRKLRFGARGKGTRGGSRVIYYVLDKGHPIVALLIYGKNEQANFTTAQRKVMASVVQQLKARWSK
jgi:mRNA-degrading endonuclease RelE of RelBE toxin-antitoxin system